MSQASRSYQPNFNLVVQEPGEQFPYSAVVQHQTNNIPQQWMQQRSRSVQLNIPSPVNSVVSTMTFPSQQRRSFDVSSLHQHQIAPSNDRRHPDLLGLDMLAPSAPDTRNSYSPVARDYNEESWNAFNLRTSEGTGDFQQSNGLMRSIQQGPGSVGNAAPRSDSGFYSQSGVSLDASCMDRSPIQCSPVQRIGEDGSFSTPNTAQQMLRVHSDQQSQVSHTSSGLATCNQCGMEFSGRYQMGNLSRHIRQQHSQKEPETSSEYVCPSENAENPLKCRECGVISKCKSDDKKHQLKHEKPWRCDWPKCKRREEGFTTSNDLDRHKKSVHHVHLLDKSYQCKAKSCKNRGKIWPRRDNFKQHIERMHQDEDIDDLIRRSTFVPKQPGNNMENLSVAPTDTIVLGMERSVSSQDSYDPVAELFTPEGPNMTQWSATLDPTGGPLDLHRASTSLPRSRANSNHLSIPRKPDRTRFNMQSREKVPQQSPHNGFMNSSGKAHAQPELVPEKEKRQPPNISNKPQTKAEQQRMALKKFSQAVSNDSSTDVDLEQAVLRILAGTSHHGTDEEESGTASGGTKRHSQAGKSNVFLSKSEAIAAAQAISNLIKQSPGSAYSQPRKTNQTFVANPKICHLCNYAVARACDLKKHMKRHEKPYGCTYPKCHKRFGAKSDWKRHENSQHFQLEAYRCNHVSSAGRICGEHFFRIEHFKKHLELQHKMCNEDERIAEAKRRRIGKNCQQQFWCGFHGDIIELKEKRNAAWDERFDHIAHHFEKDKKSIEEWICVEENKTKKDLLKEMDRYVFDDDDEGARGRAPPPPPPSDPMGIPPPPPVNVTPSPPPSASRKRNALEEPVDVRSHKKQHREYRDQQAGVGDAMKRYCCQCGDGPSNVRVQPSCMECGHVDRGCCDIRDN